MSSVPKIQDSSAKSQSSVAQSPKLPVYHNAKTMRVSGYVLAGLGASLFIASSALVLRFRIYPLIAGIGLGAAGVIAGTIFATKRYWNDPAEIERYTNEARQLDFESLIKIWYRDPNFDKLTFRPSEMAKKFVEFAKRHNLNYAQILQSVGQYDAKYNFFNKGLIKELMLERLRTQTIAQFMAFEQANTPGYQQFNKLFTDHILDAAELTEKFAAEVQGKGLEEVLITYGWNIFDLGVASLQDYRAEIQAEVAQVDNGAKLGEFLNKYSSEIVKRNVFPHADAFKQRFVQMMRVVPFTSISDDLLADEYGFVPDAWKVKVAELRQKHGKYAVWKSDQLKAAETRFRDPNNHQFNYVSRTELMMLPNGGMMAVPRVDRVPNYHYYGYHYVQNEIDTDNNVRRPAKYEAKINTPWRQFLAAQPNA